MDPIKVLVVDDHSIFRQGLISILADEPSISIVGEAGDGNEAVAKARELMPDIILMDLLMPEISGAKSTETIMRETPHIGIIILTVCDEEKDLIQAIKAGAKGYLLKDSLPETIINAVKTVYNKGAILSPSIAAKLLAEFKQIHREAGAGKNILVNYLTDREIEVLQLLSEGYNNKKIAEKMNIGPSTVKNHVSNILSKLQLENRVQAAVFAAQEGLIKKI